ncbi:phosphoglycerate kinase PGKII [Cardiosporidium cionae]|uniref:Phosphoglycerate kinase n=1 Tax=Cardiosporidium cionae TaxID=476202 RepID=A0ABQ7JAS0_9APIC|nr:phosphoglycerate kinase PGKII [Cardiosporidium cionae]|eukprot:KAF8821091.1 phosphoglycerate kinase PGKII [Cardiosporidium cionae]
MSRLTVFGVTFAVLFSYLATPGGYSFKLRTREISILSPCGVQPLPGRKFSKICNKLRTQCLAKRSLTSLTEEDLAGKRVFVRCDLNVPMDGKTITDDTRIRASIPTLKYLVDSGAKVIVASHLGRPKSGPEEKYSLMSVAPRLSELLGVPIGRANDCIGDEVTNKIEKMRKGDVLLLENVRFHKEETKNDKEFSKHLARNVDVFVNDAFGTAHRAHGSTAGIANFVHERVAGFLLQKELTYLQNSICSPERPFTAIIGGSKVSTKIDVIEAMLDRVDRIVLGGAMVFTFLKAKGLYVGNSIVEDDKLEFARSLEEKAAQKGVKFILPVDVVVANRFSPDADWKVVPITEIPKGWIGLDNGPATTKIIESALQDSRTVLWNGPMGVSEWDNFAAGTIGVMESLAALTLRGATTIVGGGDSISAAERYGFADKMSHISTGGGAALELLEGKELPGVTVLQDEAL